MTTTPSAWSARLGWCAFFLMGAAVVTSGFEVPGRVFGPAAAREARPSFDSSLPKPGPANPSVTAEAHPQRGATDVDLVEAHQMNLRELEDRIRELEARLAERQAVQMDKEVARQAPASSVGPLGKQEQLAANEQLKSARDEEIEHDTEERATRMISDIRDQLKQLEVERARQVEEMLDAAK